MEKRITRLGIMLFSLLLSIIIFIIGIIGIFLSRKNIILIIMSLELMLLASNYNFLFFSIYLDDLIGEIFSLLILSVGASESALGLALVISYYRTYRYI
jgi:NADH-quinone oxidoreductase subunit K